MISWPDEFCQGLVDRGFFVIRFDNRDIGLSTHIHLDPEVDVAAAVTAMLAGQPPEAPYHLADMAADAAGCSTPWASTRPTWWVPRWAA